MSAKPVLRRGRDVLLYSCVVVAALPVALYGMFSRLSPVDDETFFLLPVRLVADGGRLYDDVFNSYGPLYFDVYVPLSHLFGGITHERGRLIVIGLWIGSSVLAGIVAQRITGSIWIGLAATAVEFRLMSALAEEPMNPAALINVLLMVTFLVATRRSSRRTFMALGSLAMGIALVKINVGGLCLIALLLALIATGPRRPRLERAAQVVTFALVPVAFTLRELDVYRTVQLLVIVVASGVAAAVAIHRCTGSRRELSGLKHVVAGAAITSLVVFLVTALVCHTTVGGFVDGALVQAVRVSGSFSLFAPVPFLLAAGAFAATVGGHWLLIKSTRLSPTCVTAALKLAAGAAGWVACMTTPFGDGSFVPMAVGVPTAWLVVANDGGARTRNEQFIRAFIASAAVLQTLYAHPVAGQQRAFGAALLVVTAAICVGDGVRTLWEPTRATMRWRAASVVVPGLACLTIAVSLVAPLPKQHRNYVNHVSVGYAGAEKIHGPATTVGRLHWMVDHVRGCRQLVTIPGMSSVYWFSGIKPPTFLPQVWVKLLSAKRQREVISLLTQEPRSCVIYDEAINAFWLHRPVLPPTPLVTYLRKNFRVAATLNVQAFGEPFRILSLRKSGRS